jgi:hypothetical protein
MPNVYLACTVTDWDEHLEIHGAFRKKPDSIEARLTALYVRVGSATYNTNTLSTGLPDWRKSC